MAISSEESTGNVIPLFKEKKKLQEFECAIVLVDSQTLKVMNPEQARPGKILESKLVSTPDGFACHFICDGTQGLYASYPRMRINGTNPGL